MTWTSLNPEANTGYGPPMILHSIGGKEGISIRSDVDLEDRSPYRVFHDHEPYPTDQGLVQRVIDNHKFYDLILTWRESVLQACPNAVKYLHAGPYLSILGNDFVIPSHVGWYTTPEPRYVAPLNSAKVFSASFLTSHMNDLSGHFLSLLEYCQSINIDHRLGSMKMREGISSRISGTTSLWKTVSTTTG